MKVRLILIKVLLALLGVSYGVTGLMFISTLTPGGLSLGLSMFGLSLILYLLWAMLRTLWQIRELLMLSTTRAIPDATVSTLDFKPYNDEKA